MAPIFKIKSQEGFIWKLLAELLASNLKECCLRCNQTGIYVQETDDKCESGSKYICISLYKDRFKLYQCQDELLIGLNLINFFKLLKSIKRKDSITMYIEDTDPQKLIIEIEPQGDTKSVKKCLNIINVPPNDVTFAEEDNYGDSILATSKEFQKLKTLNKMSKETKVTLEDKSIKFYANKPDLYSSEVIFGEKSDNIDHDNVEIYTQHFNTEDIIQLIKIAGLSPSVYIYYTSGMPLKINLNAGTLGDVSICTKSREMIEDENQDRE